MNWIIDKQDVREYELDSTGSEKGLLMSFCEKNTEPSST
jgi:hypothetical protein